MEKSLEQQFNEAQKQALKEIKEKLKIANDALTKAEEISDETGVPFDSGISPLSQQYVPSSFHIKWEGLDLDSDELENLDYVHENEGWEHSAVC